MKKTDTKFDPLPWVHRFLARASNAAVFSTRKYLIILFLVLGVVLAAMCLAGSYPPFASKTTFLGLPLVATGDVAMGKQVSIGGIAFGGIAIGFVAVGGCAVGVFSFGGGAIGLIAAFGGGALGYYSFGGGSIGAFAYSGNGVAKGYYVAEGGQHEGLFSR